MIFSPKYSLLALLALGYLSYASMGCWADGRAADARDLGWRNLDNSVAYVGMETCKSCHQTVHEHYQHTGMGLSFGRAHPSKAKANFEHPIVVYDSARNFYYQPFFKDSVLYIKEFRLQGQDTIHSLVERIDYIIGSGHHTNSHLISREGYLFQAPITYYVQEQRWDLAPGFEKGKNQRFSRIIASECLTCHNHLPKLVPGSENKYESMPLGIECERCHGAGGLHVKEKLAGIKADTAKGPDYTIVNPRRLPLGLQLDLCQRCHLQGLAVLQEGKTFFDFRPGMWLSEVMQIYLPRFSDSDERFIMASQADRLRLSDCFKTGEMSCITCHHPHYSVKDRSQNRYQEACLSCHSDKGKSKLKDCSVPMSQRQAKGNFCADCHLPKVGSIDIPHVRISDHYISRETARGQHISNKEKQEIKAFLGLQALTPGGEQPKQMAKAYLDLYDKFMPENLVLDSARHYLERLGKPNAQTAALWLHYHFTKQQYAEAVALADLLPAAQLREAWTAYRLGDSFLKLKKWPQAQAYLELAVGLLPYQLDFQDRLGVCYAESGQLDKAQSRFQFILKEQPKRPSTLSNLGFLRVQQQRYDEALRLYQQALALDPDYEMAKKNLAALRQFFGG